jgi:phosphatidylglycerophosphatase A
VIKFIPYPLTIGFTAGIAVVIFSSQIKDFFGLQTGFLPADFKIVVLAFLIFRILDTFKPYPAGRLQNLHGSAGVMVDDLIAGIYTNIVLQVILKLVSFKAV